MLSTGYFSNEFLELDTILNKLQVGNSDQCCGSKYIELGSGSRSGSGSRVKISILKEKRKNCKN